MKKILAVLLTILIFAVILIKIDTHQLIYYFAHMNLLYFLCAMLLFFPMTLVSAYRWKLLIKNSYNISLVESFQLLLMCGSLNAITPSKLGDFAKAYILKKERKLNLKRGLTGAIIEKILDLNFLCVFTLIGLLLIKTTIFTLPILLFSLIVFFTTLVLYFIDFSKIKFVQKILLKIFREKNIKLEIKDMYDYVLKIKKNKKLLISISCASFLIWFLNLIQIYFLFLSLGYSESIKLIFAFVPIALLIGMIPITIAGMGTRDSALIVLFAKYMPASFMLGIGLLLSLRYWIPAVIGLPFIKKYLGK